ncbi:HlyD family efflux transporter periplasmic adaptor subunit [Miniphocaeibacter halophilus]|uniref:Uncharacterized protein n=1 Tax=Miniphocaeibacter halophilus TaxID=2931922 RepID=A0AC61MSY2_9FIRM|nr:HlyD family efflux transporter periplasmic adaptor subunit [Miniphocaeibacter halophilus]QQK07695.1 hypothetical protein JFY71_10450 [Miniphocaeibacter halophilus]
MNKIKSKNKTNKKKFKINIFSLIFLFILLILIKNIYVKFVKNNTIILDSPVIYEEKINTNAIILKDEHIYAYDENINLNAKSTSRISVDTSLGSINDFTNKFGLNIDIINNELEKLKEKNKNQETLPIEDIVESIHDYNYSKIGELPIDNYEDHEIEYKKYLESQNNIYKSVLESNGQKIKSKNAGVLFTEVDGYEDIFNIYRMDLNLLDLDIENLDLDKESHKNGLKIVNNNYFGMIFTVNSKDVKKSYEVGGDITIKINDTYITGTVKDIKLNNKIFTIAAYFDTNFDSISDNRFYNIDIVNFSTKSYKIPEKSLTTNKDTVGVYIKKPSGVVVFRPVEVITIKDKTAIVNYGNKGLIKINGKEMETINPYDEIIKNPKKVKLGELLE